MSDEQPVEMTDFVSIMAKTKDEDMRLMLSVVFGLFARLEKKFDLVLRDERALRQAVLNGHAGNHSSDHDEWGKFKGNTGRVLAAVEWVEERQAAGGMCPWGAAKMAEEQVVETAVATAKVKQKFDIRTAVITAALSLAAMGAAAFLFGGKPL